MFTGDREVIKEIESLDRSLSPLLEKLIAEQQETNHLLKRLGATIAQKGQ